MRSKIRLENGDDIHVATDDGYIRLDIGGGLLSVLVSLSCAEAEMLGTALTDAAKAMADAKSE